MIPQTLEALKNSGMFLAFAAFLFQSDHAPESVPALLSQWVKEFSVKILSTQRCTIPFPLRRDSWVMLDQKLRDFLCQPVHPRAVLKDFFDQLSPYLMSERPITTSELCKLMSAKQLTPSLLFYFTRADCLKSFRELLEYARAHPLPGDLRLLPEKTRLLLQDIENPSWHESLRKEMLDHEVRALVIQFGYIYL